MFFIFILLISVSCVSTQSLPPLTYACRTAKSDECSKSRFVPGHTLLGEGLDIVTMKKKGAYVFNLQTFMTREKTCTVCENPYMNKEWQKVPLGVVDWKPQSSCVKKISGETSRTTSSLAQESASSIENNWEVGLELHHAKGNGTLVLAGSHSQLAQFGQSKSSGDRYTFLRHHMSCMYYGLRLTHMPALSLDFNNSLRSLPATYDSKTQDKYRKLITTYGTHYISQANVGGEAQQVTAIRTCQATMDGMSLDELKDCLSIEASAAITGEADFNAKAKASACKNKRQKVNHGETFHQTYNERIWKINGGTITYDMLSFDSKNSNSASIFEKWMDSLKTDPDIVSYSLEPIHNLVRFKGPQQENLKKAVSDYIMEMALRQKCSCPSGSLMNPTAECSCVCQGTNHRNSNCCPSKKGLAKLVVTVESASNLWGDYISKTDAYVKVSYGLAKGETSTIWNNNNPVWKARFDLGFVELSDATSLKVEVWDEDNKYDDDLLGTCSKKVNQGSKPDICYLKHGSVSYSVSAECVPHLTGHLCREYAASPN